MILEDVDLADGYCDDQRLAGSATRSMRITTDEGSFTTPARMISRGEHMSRSEIPLSRELPRELTVDFMMLADGDVRGLTAGGRSRTDKTRSGGRYGTRGGRHGGGHRSGTGGGGRRRSGASSRRGRRR